MRKKVKCILGVLLLIILVGVYSIVDKTTHVYDTEIPVEEYVLSEEISMSKKISQEFISEVDSIDAISIKCIVNEPIIDRELIYSITNQKGIKLVEGKIQISSLKTGKFNRVDIPTTNNSKGQRYTIQIASKEERTGVFFYKTNPVNDNIKIKPSEKVQNDTLVLRVITHKFDWETFLVVSGFVVYIILFIRMLYKFFN